MIKTMPKMIRPVMAMPSMATNIYATTITSVGAMR